MRWLFICLVLWLILIGLTYREPLMDLGLQAASDVEEAITVAQAKPGAGQANGASVLKVELR